MEVIQVEQYSDAVNAVILRTPGRSFPGMVIQGDSLRILLRKAERGIESFAAGNMEEGRDYLLEITEDLKDRLIHYEEVLKAHGFDLPYSGAVSPQDSV